MELKLTRKFEELWLERVGNWPTVEAVAHFVRHSVKVQRGEDLLRKDGQPFRMFAIYWHPELDLVIKIDAAQQAAVTVMTRENWHKNKQGAAVPLPGSDPRSGLASRIARIKAAFGRRVA